MSLDVSVVVTTSPGREKLLSRALNSISAQNVVPRQIVVQNDTGGYGIAASRNSALARVTSGWVTFLNDNDEMYSHHIEQLYTAAHTRFTDLVYPWYDLCIANRLQNQLDPRTVQVYNGVRSIFALQFSSFVKKLAADGHDCVPTVFLAKTSILRRTGGFTDSRESNTSDPDLVKNILRAGYVIRHAATRSWRWNRDLEI